MVRLIRSQTGEVSFVLDGTLALLRSALRNAYRFPTYRGLFHRRGVDENMLRVDTTRAFRQLSPSSKTDYIFLQNDSFERIHSRRFATDWTSGSTAKPLLRISSPSDEAGEAEAVRRAFHSCGISRDDRVAFLDVGASDIYLFYGRVLSALGVRGTCFIKTSRRQGTAAHAIARLKPTVIVSVPSVLGKCLMDLALQKSKLPGWDLRKVIYIGEAMTSRLRSEIRQKLGAACLSFYGTTEVGSVGIECERSEGIHIPLDLMIPTLIPHEGRVLRLRAPNSYEGVLAWTSLTFRDHPVIKYCVSDLVHISLRACACGSPFPTMHFQRRLDHSLSLFGIKFSYELFLEHIQRAVGSPADLEIRALQAASDSRNTESFRISFVLADCYRPYLNRCKAEILAIHPMEDFVDRGLLQLRFHFEPVTHFHRRKTRCMLFQSVSMK